MCQTHTFHGCCGPHRWGWSNRECLLRMLDASSISGRRWRRGGDTLLSYYNFGWITMPPSTCKADQYGPFCILPKFLRKPLTSSYQKAFKSTGNMSLEYQHEETESRPTQGQFDDKDLGKDVYDPLQTSTEMPVLDEDSTPSKRTCQQRSSLWHLQMRRTEC